MLRFAHILFVSSSGRLKCAISKTITVDLSWFSNCLSIRVNRLFNFSVDHSLYESVGLV